MARAKSKRHRSEHQAAVHHSRHHRVDQNADHARNEAEEIMSAGREQMGRMQRSAFDSLGFFSGPMSRIMEQHWSMVQRMMQAMQGESLRFFNRRLEHASHVIENSRDFNGVPGLMQLQQEWMLDFARDYSEQPSRFGQLMRELAAESTERFSELSSEVLDEAEDNLEEAEHEADRAAA